MNGNESELWVVVFKSAHISLNGSKIIYKINDYPMFIYWEADEMGPNVAGRRFAAKQTAKKKKKDLEPTNKSPVMSPEV